MNRPLIVFSCHDKDNSKMPRTDMAWQGVVAVTPPLFLGAPMLLEEAQAAGVEPARRSKHAAPTPACDKMRAIGQWNQACDPS
jgi:hypothetical protein